MKRASYQTLIPKLRRNKNAPAVWFVRWREGKTRRERILGTLDQYPNLASAQVAADELRRNVNAGKPTVTGHLFGYLIDEYTSKEMPTRHATRKSYSAYIKHHIRPKWENQPIAAIAESPLEIRVWLEGLELAPKSKAHVKSIMHRLFETAMLYRMIPTQRNPMELVRLKTAKRLKAPRILTADQSRELREKLPAPFSLMVLIIQCFGLRASEVLGLKWSDFDFVKGEVTIRRAFVDGILGDVKTEYSGKPLPVAEELAAAILAWRQVTQFNGSDDWVFASPFLGGQKPYCYTAMLEKLKAVGGTGLHIFRHTYRALLNKTGTPIGVQKDLMRHASIKTTMDEYGGTLSDDMREANRAVVKLLM